MIEVSRFKAEGDARDGILILDATTRKITRVNPFLTTLLDYPAEHFLGEELWEIQVVDDTVDTVLSFSMN